MKRRINLFFVLTLLLLDASLAGLAFFFAYHLRLNTETPPPLNIPPFSRYSGMMLLHVLSLVAVFFLYKLYHRQRAASLLDELSSILAATSIGTVVAVAATSFLYKNELDYPRLMIAYAWMLTILWVSFGRVLHARLRALLRQRGMDKARLLVVGVGETGRSIGEAIRRAPHLGYRLVGFVSNGDRSGEDLGAPLLGSTSHLAELIRTHHIDEVIIALPQATHDELLEIISECQMQQVNIKVFPDVFQIMAAEISVGDLGGLPLLTVKDIALRGWKLTLKRLVDVLGSGIGLVLLSPLLLLTAVLIKFDSKGSAFYTQERMGLDLKPFPLLKFRSMIAGAEHESGPVWAVRDDPRRTRLGTILRRYSLDELPQLINVLLGEMSLVGPRPERPYFVEQFKQRVPRYLERHREKAGMTGWAQVNGLRGEAPIAERTKYDLWYIENWSLLLDLKIVLKTLTQIFRDRNAY